MGPWLGTQVLLGAWAAAAAAGVWAVNLVGRGTAVHYFLAVCVPPGALAATAAAVEKRWGWRASRVGVLPGIAVSAAAVAYQLRAAVHGLRT